MFGIKKKIITLKCYVSCEIKKYFKIKIFS